MFLCDSVAFYFIELSCAEHYVLESIRVKLVSAARITCVPKSVKEKGITSIQILLFALLFVISLLLIFSL